MQSELMLLCGNEHVEPSEFIVSSENMQIIDINFDTKTLKKRSTEKYLK